MNVGTPLNAVAGVAAPAFVPWQSMMGNMAGSRDTSFIMNDDTARYRLMTATPGGGSAGGARGAGSPSAPAGAGSPPKPADPKRFLERTSTPDGELKLLEDALTGSEEGFQWMEMVRLGVAGEAAYAELIGRPLVKALREMTSTVMAPEVDNFKLIDDTPWGGTRIAAEMKKGLGNWKPGLVVGESWEISGHPKFPNEFEFDHAGQRIAIDMNALREMFSKNLFGRRVAGNEVTGMPFLVKLLNSGSWQGYISELSVMLSKLDERKGADEWRKSVGVHASLMELAGRNYDEIHQGISRFERLIGSDDDLADGLKALHKKMLTRNLSVQVHPTSDYEGLKEGEHSKTEAWIIVDAEEGAGIYLGLKEGVTKGEFEKTLKRGGDVTQYLNFVPVESGEVYFIPAGTIHAIGAGVLLVEPQETSETTYRVYDYGRLDDKGRPRQLHVKQAIAVTRWEGPRGTKAVSSYRRMPEVVPGPTLDSAFVERLVDEELFRTNRVTFTGSEVYEGYAEGIAGFNVIEGAVEVEAGHGLAGPREFLKGQSFIIPAATGRYTIRGSSPNSVLIETSEAYTG